MENNNEFNVTNELEKQINQIDEQFKNNKIENLENKEDLEELKTFREIFKIEEDKRDILIFNFDNLKENWESINKFKWKIEDEELKEFYFKKMLSNFFYCYEDLLSLFNDFKKEKEEEEKKKEKQKEKEKQIKKDFEQYKKELLGGNNHEEIKF